MPRFISYNMTMTEIESFLFSVRDEKYATFISALLPSIQSKYIIGIKTPILRKYAKGLTKDLSDDFIKKLPHKYFEENQLHAFILSTIRNFDECVKSTDRFLQYVDNWATCDQLSPKIFAKNTDKLFPYIQKWIKSNHTYTVRFAIGLLMQFYLGNNFNLKYANMVANVKSDEYYINMMRAWYFATALAKNYNETISFLENNVLDNWTHNKTIQKAIESYRIDDKTKTYLRTLKINIKKENKNER